MKSFVMAAAFLGLFAFGGSAEARRWVTYSPVIVGPSPVFVAPAPVTTFYAPVPQTVFYQPAPVFVRPPVVVPPRAVFPGQPVRNFFRPGVVVW
jgi:hypothetical protein